MAEDTAGRVNGRSRPRGYADWRPRPATVELLDQVGEILREYEDHLPLTIRQIFYRLVASYGYDKTDNSYGRLGEHLVRARRARMISFDMIRDDGVVTYSSRWHDGIEDFWNDAARRAKDYRRARQTGQPHYVELWCEAAGMAPQLARVADKYSVPVFSSGGFSSLTAVRLIAERALDRTVPTILLHVGDLDPSGESIFDSMAADAAAFVEADRIVYNLRLVPVRLALTREQVVEYDLPTAPAKKEDKRSRRWEGETCQLEALAPDQLAAIVDDEIRSLIRPDQFNRQVEIEQDERRQILKALPTGETR